MNNVQLFKTRLTRALHLVRQRIGGSTMWLLAGRVSTQAFSVLFIIVVARRTGNVVLGQYSFFIALVHLANVITTFGTDMLVIREVAGEGKKELAGLALALQWMLCIPAIIFLGWGLPAFITLDVPILAAIRIYGFALIPLSLLNVASAILRGLEAMRTYTLINLAVAGLQIAGVLVFVEQGGSAVRLAMVMLGVQVGGALLAVGLVWQQRVEGLLNFTLDRPALRWMIRFSAPVALIAFLGIVFQRSIVLLLTPIAGAQATGWYSVAARVVELFKFTHYAVMTALLPVMVKKAKLQLKGLFSTALLTLLIYAGAVSVTLFFAAELLVRLLFGSEFTPSIALLQALTWVLVPFTLSNYFATALFAVGQELVLLPPLAISVLVVVVVGLVMIQRWGAFGGVMAAMIGEIVQAAGYLIVWVRYAKERR